jgi:hypothetical protein
MVVIMKKLIFIPIFLLSITLPKQLLSFEKCLPVVWAGSAALETLSLLSKDVRHMIYGNNPVNESAKEALNKILSPLNLNIPSDIQESRSVWPIMAGNIFANHDSLFVSKNTLDQIQSGIFNDQAKKDLIAATLMIKNNFDAKVLAAYIATPIIVWTGIHYLHALMQKINSSAGDNPWIKKIASITTQCKESFNTKALIALSMTGAFILYQRHAINGQTTALLL